MDNLIHVQSVDGWGEKEVTGRHYSLCLRTTLLKTSFCPTGRRDGTGNENIQ